MNTYPQHQQQQQQQQRNCNGLRPAAHSPLHRSQTEYLTAVQNQLPTNVTPQDNTSNHQVYLSCLNNDNSTFPQS